MDVSISRDRPHMDTKAPPVLLKGNCNILRFYIQMQDAFSHSHADTMCCKLLSLYFQITIKCLTVLYEIPNSVMQRKATACFESIQHMIACSCFFTAKVFTVSRIFYVELIRYVANAVDANIYCKKYWKYFTVRCRVLKSCTFIEWNCWNKDEI